jgi:hypothetical protein
VERIKQDAELLPSMFRAEAVFRNQCKKERDEAEETMKVSIHSDITLIRMRSRSINLF